jgi:hypothetical protein
MSTSTSLFGFDLRHGLAGLGFAAFNQRFCSVSFHLKWQSVHGNPQINCE